MMKKITRTLGAVFLALALALNMTACSGDKPDNSKVTMAYLPSWTDGQSMYFLLEHFLTEAGYQVEAKTLSDAALLYAGLSNGDADVYPSAWPDVTHISYWNRYQKDIEKVGAYYQGAKLTLAVPSYVDIDTIDELAAQPGRFQSKVYGIEPGAGHMRITAEEVMPGYGMGDWELVSSSTTAMLTELDSAIRNQRDIVVTLWRPFWAYSQFDVKDLTDTKGLYGQEDLYFIARKGFAKDYPEVAEWMGKIKLSAEEYADLEYKITTEFGEGRETEAVEAWLAAHPGVMPKLPKRAK